MHSIPAKRHYNNTLSASLSRALECCFLFIFTLNTVSSLESLFTFHIYNSTFVTEYQLAISIMFCFCSMCSFFVGVQVDFSRNMFLVMENQTVPVCIEIFDGVLARNITLSLLLNSSEGKSMVVGIYYDNNIITIIMM